MATLFFSLSVYNSSWRWCQFATAYCILDCSCNTCKPTTQCAWLTLKYNSCIGGAKSAVDLNWGPKLQKKERKKERRKKKEKYKWRKNINKLLRSIDFVDKDIVTHLPQPLHHRCHQVNVLHTSTARRRCTACCTHPFECGKFVSCQHSGWKNMR